MRPLFQSPHRVLGGVGDGRSSRTVCGVTRSRSSLAGTILVAVVVLVAAGAVGCDAGAVSPRIGADQREHRVAADPHATAADIIGAGRAVDVAATPDRTLITYRVESDDDEGPQQGAWRLYDAHDRRLADGTFGIVREQSAVARALVAGDGFVLESYTEPRLRLLDPSGELTDLAAAGPASPAQPGDVLLEADDDAGRLLYRPAERATYRLPRVPFRDSQRVVLDEQGSVWVLREWSRHRVPVAYAQGGVGAWAQTEVPSAPDDYPVGLASGHDRVVVTLGHGGDEHPRVVSFALLGPARPAAGWTPVAPAGITARDPLDPEVHVLPDGRLLFVAWREGAWLQSGSHFVRLELPDSEGSEPDLTVEPAGDRLFAVPELGRRLWVSADDGTTWKRFGS